MIFLGVICAVTLLVLLFPFTFWIKFEVNERKAEAGVFLFKKQLKIFAKNFKPHKETSSGISTDSSETPEECSLKKEEVAPEISLVEPKNESENFNQDSLEKASQNKVNNNLENADALLKEDNEKNSENILPKNEIAEEENLSLNDLEVSSKNKKRALSDVEFWTLLLTPDFDAYAFKNLKKWMNALCKLFRIKFIDCIVEGIRMSYLHMGYGAALNGFLKSFPYIKAWDFRMDWTLNHELKSTGKIRMSVNLCRILGLILATIIYGGVVLFSFYKRRRFILKTGNLPALGFIRKKILNIMVED